MKKILFYLLAAILPIIIYQIYYGIFGGNHRWMISLTLLSIFVLSFILFNKKERKEDLILGFTIVFPIFLIFLITSFFTGFSRTLLYLIFIPISTYLGWLFFKRKSILTLIFSLILFSFVGVILFPNIFILQKNVGVHTNEKFDGISLVDKNKEIVKLDKSKIIILDFWTTSCGVCFKKFPDLEKYYLEFKDNPDVEFYSINVPLKRDDFSKVVKLVDDLNYEFPTLYATSKKEVENLGIYAYPHLLILKNGKLRYDGRLETDKYIFVNHLKSEINKLITE
ncbi:Thiol-disulfide isomerase or thioredoxin [Lutibacter oricola]|uniref:Thiol-disulfide isomerase or thioredoxin n=1 Tax=Lutibacter oricola TaxID=762486 RepID=A0A1H3GX46_9FLAO|nr:TlpA disulfide reductase family protein [Lutibacter oricola]SDY07084.1 Thiol-disulfide isomerase or thioredoxin [Lutibacter oricola]